MIYKKIKISDYTYYLPDEKIAKYPLENRQSSNLLLFNKGEISKRKFFELDNYLPENNLLVVNNTKVIYARIIFFKQTGSKIEIFCLKPYEPNEYSLAFDAKNKCSWVCIVGNLKKWKQGKLTLQIKINNIDIEINAEKIDTLNDKQIIEFQWNSDFTFSEILEHIGQIPIPPYLNRQSEEIDKTRYQTVYSKIGGSVAAPTAGLHFTDKIFDNLQKKNISKVEVTLHVGAGTFKPVKTKEIGRHEMHTEFFTISKDAFLKILNNLGNITAVGTTSMRTLESIYNMGVKKILKKTDFNFIHQWEVYELPEIDAKEALEALLEEFDENGFLTANTQIIIVPGYKFKLVNYLITNFHQPNSTLLLLVAAFVGQEWRKIYDFALNNEFRFLSYGDSSLLIP